MLLVDCCAVVFRAWGAAKDKNFAQMRNSAGEPTAALLVFLRTILKALSVIPGVTHVVIAMDGRRGDLNRTRRFRDYKANRPEVPLELEVQLRKVEEACAAFGWHCHHARGFEADDVIYTWTRLALMACPSAAVHIVSPDKDMLQLAQAGVVLHRNLSALEKVTDEVDIEHEWKVRPDQFADYLALVGDSADNVPGVRGIGKVTAARLLQQHGSLEGLLRAAHLQSPAKLPQQPALPPKLREALLWEEEWVRAAKEVVQLETVFPLGGVEEGRLESLDAARLPPGGATYHRAAALEYCEQEQLLSLARKVRYAHRQPESGVPVIVLDGMPAAATAMSTLKKNPGRFGVVVKTDGTEPLCAAVCAEPGVDLGGARCFWVDLRPGRGGQVVLEALAEFFETPAFEKVYHLFGDARRGLLRHVPPGEDGGRHRGLAADVMHMARLWNPALRDYSLPGLASELLERNVPSMPGRGSQEVVEELQSCCSARGAALLDLHDELRCRLREQPWEVLEGGGVSMPSSQGSTMLDFYEAIWRDFGDVLSDMEMAGFHVDRARLAELTGEAEALRASLERDFRGWVERRLIEEREPAELEGVDLRLLSLRNQRQLAHLLFGTGMQRFRLGGASEGPDGVCDGLEFAAAFAADGTTSVLPRPSESDYVDFDSLKVAQLKEFCRERGLKVGGRKAELVERLKSPGDLSHRARGRRPPRELWLPGLGFEPLEEYRSRVLKVLQVSRESLLALCASQPEQLRPDGLQAISVLLKWREADKLLQFMRPLEVCSRDGRVHASFNLNTETGRISSRNPNLQQQPLGFDVPVRDAFVAPPGCRLVVADYSQLELRVVAHLAGCPAMLEVLCSQGDIHSSTAYRMFEEVRRAVDAGEVALHTHSGPGLPLVKDVFQEQRKKAKVLNFSLLYGKTAYGLAKDWAVSREEAEAMIERWFAAFPKVAEWIHGVEEAARKGDFSRTILGRIRPIHATRSNAGLRQAVNSPVQGSAADIVTAASVALAASRELRRLGYRQILQVHDEIILEGPEASAETARQEVLRIMEDPLPFPLLAPLSVDARIARTWAQGK